MTTEVAADKPKRPQSNRRRRPQGGKRPRKTENATPKAEDGAQNTTEKPAAPKKERSPVVPPPAELFGTRVAGFVNTVIKKGKLNFGFLSIGTDEATVNETTPRIYFNPSCIGEEGKVILRRGYAVEFNVEKDEKDRPVAKDIKLTAEGAKTRMEREAALAKAREERDAAPQKKRTERAKPQKEEKAPAAEAPAGEESRKQKRPRKRPEGRKITLKVKSEGSEEKSIEINVNQNIGRIKVMAAKELGVSTDASVYANGEFLTKVILRKLNDNDTIELGPKKESTTA